MKTKKSGKGFLLSILISLMFNLEWTVPAWVFLVLHLLKGISLWWFLGSMILWVIIVALRILVFDSLTRAGDYKDPPKENKNPYSKTYLKK